MNNKELAKNLVENKCFESSAPKSLVFHGYEDIVKNFWGIDDYPIPDSEWSKKDVIFLDTDETNVSVPEETNDGINLVFSDGFSHEEEMNVKVKGVDFKVFSVQGDGGGNFYLFDANDYERLMKLDNTLVWVKNEQ